MLVPWLQNSCVTWPIFAQLLVWICAACIREMPNAIRRAVALAAAPPQRMQIMPALPAVRRGRRNRSLTLMRPGVRHLAWSCCFCLFGQFALEQGAPIRDSSRPRRPGYHAT